MTGQKQIGRWSIVVSSVLILMCLGVAYAWGVFLTPLASEFGWGRGPTSLAVSILLLVFSVFMVVGGVMERKYGPRATATIGGVFMGIGWILAYFTKSLTWLYLTYGVLAGIGTGLAYLPSLSTSIKWFPDKRGLVGGIVVFGFGFGAAFLAPLAAAFIESYGWRITMLIFGAGFGTVIIGASQFLKKPPPDWKPDNWSPAQSDNINTKDFPPVKMLKTKTFKLMFLTYFISMVAGMMVIGHIVAFARDMGYVYLHASFTLTVIAITNGAGRIFFGWISDKIGSKNTLVILFSLIGLIMLTFTNIKGLAVLYSVSAIIGLCFGGFLAVYPAVTADYFGTKYFGINYGLVFIGYGLGSFAGPGLGGMVYDIANSYSVAFVIAGVLSVAAGILIFILLRRPSVTAFVEQKTLFRRSQ